MRKERDKQKRREKKKETEIGSFRATVEAVVKNQQDN